MEENSDCVVVPSLTYVVEHIYSSCDTNKDESVPVSALLEFMRPLLSNHTSGIDELNLVLDPNNINPVLSRTSFYEAMEKWTAKMNSDESHGLPNFSFREPDNSDDKELPFHQSTPKSSLALPTQKISKVLSMQHLSPTSFSSNTESSITGGFDKLLLEEKVKELEHKYSNAVNELSLVKSQLTLSEEQYAELKMDLDRTNKRLTMEQQVNADLQKSLEQKDALNDQIQCARKEIDHLQKMVSATKKENSAFIDSIKSLEYEKEQLHRKINEIRKKEENRKKEIDKLQAIVALKEEETENLKKFKNVLEDKLEEQTSMLQHVAEVSEIMQNENETLHAVIKKSGAADHKNLSNLKDIPNSPILASLNRNSDTLDDLDSTVDSENPVSKGQDLLSELQACKFLDNRNKCFIDDHAEWLKIVKEHETCSQIITKYQRQIEHFAKELETVETENNKLVANYKNIEKNAESFESSLEHTKIRNKKLSHENHDLRKQITNLNNMRDDELKEMGDLKIKNKGLSEKLENVVKEKHDEYMVLSSLREKYHGLVNEKENIETQMEQMKIDIEDLFNKNDVLHSENKNLLEKIVMREEELTELQNLGEVNEILQEEINEMKDEQEMNCMKIEKLTKKLEHCNSAGKNFVGLIKRKLIDQNTKVEFLKNLNKKLEDDVEILKNEIDASKTELNTLASSTLKKNDDINDNNESTSTEGSDTNSFSGKPEFRKILLRKSTYEKQQIKMNKLEEQIQDLEEKLSSEKLKTKKISELEFQLNNLVLEKEKLEEEKKSILRELEAADYDLRLKDSMMKQFEEKLQFDMENLSKTFEKERELVTLALNETQNRSRENEDVLRQKIVQLEETLEDYCQENDNLKNMFQKKDSKIITLQKALSDLAVSCEDAKVFENLLIEKESMLMFNRELLIKSNNCLQLAESRVTSLELLLDKCRTVVLNTTDDLFRASKTLIGVCKNMLLCDDSFQKLVDDIESLELDVNCEISEITEQKMWNIHTQLSLSSQLLKALAKTASDDCVFCKKELTQGRGISKFTLRPSKLKLLRLPSRDPDISSSCTKDCESPLELAASEIDDNIVEVINSDQTAGEITEEITSNIPVEPLIEFEETDSITDYFGHQTKNLREALSNREITEKKFFQLTLTWKSNYKNTKAKYSNFKQQCSKIRDSYLRSLLQTVTFIKKHKCHREQTSLIQALKLIEKLKDIMFEVFKLSEQYGASRQELHSMKCWNLIVEYVNGVHKENERLRFLGCTSTQMITNSAATDSLSLRDISTETEKFEVEESPSPSIVDLTTGEVLRRVIPLKKHPKLSLFRRLYGQCTPTFLMMTFSIFCFVAVFCVFLHIECVRNGKGTIVCPLDFMVSVKRAPS